MDQKFIAPPCQPVEPLTAWLAFGVSVFLSAASLFDIYHGGASALSYLGAFLPAPFLAIALAVQRWNRALAPLSGADGGEKRDPHCLY